MTDCLETMIARIEERQIADAEKFDRVLLVIEKHDARINRLEQRSWMSAGAAGAVGAIAGAVGSIIVRLWK